MIIGDLLYYTQEVNNKLLVDISVIGAHQAFTTEKIIKVINQILE